LAELEDQIQFGASPRASIVMSLCARACAFLEYRGYVTPADIKKIAHPVLRHRVVASYEAEARGCTSDDIVARVLETISVP
jgi:MoxR-like ATPase